MNKGIAPPDPNTEVGRFRLLIGDTIWEPLDPPQLGFGNYRMFSDEEIEMFLGASDSVEGAISFAYYQLAGQAALSSKTVKDFDLQVDLSKRATELRLLAKDWADKAAALAADIFEVFDTVDSCSCVPELAPRTICRRGCCGGQLF